jgi:hypothetical protein
MNAPFLSYPSNQWREKKIPLPWWERIKVRVISILSWHPMEIKVF